ncbi:MAG: YceH family protein [Thermoanaerobaculales bacterium]
MPRALDPVEIRVLGCLLEKQQSTPEYYPLTVNALVAACNQKSNREPVMELAEIDVRGALNRLREDVLVWAVDGARVERWEHNLDRRLELDAAGKALVTVLLLRGPQTPGELRMRTERMHPFASLAEVEAELTRLAGGAEPVIAELAREPGRKETRWMHLAAGEVAVAPPRAPSPTIAGASLAERLAILEKRVTELTEQLDRLRASLGDEP